MENFNLKKFLVENKLTTNSRVISEGDEQSPNRITVKFNGDGFMQQHYAPTQDRNFTQTKGWDSNLKKLQSEGGLQMWKGRYYPLFRVDDEEDRRYSYWVYITYIGDKINVIQSTEHSSESADKIGDYVTSLTGITRQFINDFDNGIAPGATDHRGDFKIVKIG